MGYSESTRYSERHSTRYSDKVPPGDLRKFIQYVEFLQNVKADSVEHLLCECLETLHWMNRLSPSDMEGVDVLYLTMSVMSFLDNISFPRNADVLEACDYLGDSLERFLEDSFHDSSSEK
jgi:hypothetical protein